jgi:hypothetical protein
MTADEQGGGTAPFGGPQAPTDATTGQQGQPPPIDIRALAEKVYALLLADTRRGQALGVRRTPRGRG